MLNDYKGLKPGECVGILVSSSPIDEAHQARGHKALEALGLHHRDEPDARYGVHYLSKDPEHRVNNLVSFLQDEQVNAVWLARGGYGANLMLPWLDRQVSLPVPKPLFGSSDGCYLLWYLMERWGMNVFLAPMVYASLTLDGGYEESSLAWALFRQGEPPRVKGKSKQAFRVSGRLHGGCLSILSSLIKTSYMPNLSRTLLIIEDINERPFRLERMMWQLLASGSLDSVNAVLFGQFPNCFRDEEEKAHFLGRMEELLAPLSIPFAWDFPLGHAQRMVTVPLGVPAELTTQDGRAELNIVHIT